MNSSIVFLENEKALTSTRIIAVGCNIEHNAVMILAKKYRSELNDVGETSQFKIVKFKTAGRTGEEFFIDESQAALLIMLMKNSIPVVKFKKNLVKEFYKQRKIIARLIAQRSDQSWMDVRKDGKQVYFQKTDVIKEFVEYATKQGSKSAARYYTNIASMENKALFFIDQKYKNLREVLTIRQLMQVATADQVINKALQEGMKDKLAYQDCYKLAKERIIAFAEIIGQSPVLSLGLKTTL